MCERRHNEASSVFILYDGRTSVTKACSFFLGSPPRPARRATSVTSKTQGKARPAACHQSPPPGCDELLNSVSADWCQVSGSNGAQDPWRYTNTLSGASGIEVAPPASAQLASAPASLDSRTRELAGVLAACMTVSED